VNEQFRLLQLEIFVDESFLFVLLMVLGINPTQPDPKRRFKSQIRSKQIRIMIRSEV
jgi:hypothetical protein